MTAPCCGFLIETCIFAPDSTFLFFFLHLPFLIDFYYYHPFQGKKLPLSYTCLEHFFLISFKCLFLFNPVLILNHFRPLYYLIVFSDPIPCNIRFFTVENPALKFISLISQTEHCLITTFVFTLFPLLCNKPASLISMSVLRRGV